MQLIEIGQAVAARREALGLSQARLAKLARLSRATVNQLENGSLRDLGVAKLATLLGLLGLRLDATPVPRRAGVLDAAGRTASVSYRTLLDGRSLARALASGRIPSGLEPHVATFLDEAPLPIVVRAVEDAARTEKVPPKRIWGHLSRWAAELKSPRAAWA
jgi:transcriptional regulator with XRE-family HTH domain